MSSIPGRAADWRSASSERALLVLVLLGGIGGPARADMIVLGNGSVLVGTVVERSAEAVRIRVGREGGETRIVQTSAIQQALSGAEETEAIRACSRPAQLIAWCEQYHAAGLEANAGACLREAIRRDESLMREPREPVPGVRESGGSFTEFWNRGVLRSLAPKVGPDDGEGHLGLARWAYRGGVLDRTGFHLRRAWSLDGARLSIAALARSWNVPLIAWAQVDCRPALDHSIATETIDDDGVRIIADEGKQFVLLPVRYALRPESGTLDRTSFSRRELRGFYGIRPLKAREGLPLMDASGGPVYERLDVGLAEVQDASGARLTRLQLVARDQRAPRRKEGGKWVQNQLKGRSEVLQATGWAALVLEVPRSTDQLRIEWTDGAVDLVDLPFVLDAQRTNPAELGQRSLSAGAGRRSAESKVKVRALVEGQVVRACLSHAERGIGPMAAISIHRLGRIGRELIGRGQGDRREARVPEEWARSVEPIIVRAVAQADPRVQRAAWRYFFKIAEVSGTKELWPATTDAITTLSDDAQHLWIELIRFGIGARSGGPWWPRLEGAADTQRALMEVSYSVAQQFLGSLLRTASEGVCSEAVDLLLTIPPSQAEYSILESASTACQRKALQQIESLTDAPRADSVIRALLAGFNSQTAPAVADAASRRGLVLRLEDDAILGRWATLWEPREQAAFLTALGGVDLGPLRYSESFAAIMEDVFGPAADEPVRAAALGFAVSQAKLGLAAAEASALGPAPPRMGFPLLVARSTQDPLLKGLVEAAECDDAPLRLEALTLLVRLGYFEEASRSLFSNADTATASATLKSLLASPSCASTDGMLALLGQMLRLDRVRLVQPALAALSARIAQRESASRWELFAALKAGVDFVGLEALAREATPPTSEALWLWLHSLGHMTPQDRQRLAVETSPQGRADRLAEINFRRGRLVDGRYGVLCVLETILARGVSSAEPPEGRTSGPRINWSAPRRQVVRLPELQLESQDGSDSAREATPLGEAEYRVRWGRRTLGRGVIVEQATPIRGAGAYLPVLVSAGEGWRQGDYSSVISAAGGVGPITLPARRVLQTPVAGTMTLEIAEYLARGLVSALGVSSEEARSLVGPQRAITLRYASFGGYCGVGTPAPVPREGVREGHRHLLNLVLVLEPID